MSKEIFHPVDYPIEFDGKAYLEALYGRESLSNGNRISLFILPNFAEVIRKTTQPEERLTLLDVGSGPTIFAGVCFRHIVSKVYLSDFVNSNLKILNQWLEQRHDFDWTAVIRAIAKNEGLRTATEVYNKIESETRVVVRNGGILHSNVHDKRVITDRSKFPNETVDILVSIFCLESACSNEAEYRQALRNMVKLLRPGGYFILGSVLDDDEYVCGFFEGKPKIFSVLNLKEEFILRELESTGIDLSTMIRIGLTQQGVIFIMAKKCV